MSAVPADGRPEARFTSDPSASGRVAPSFYGSWRAAGLLVLLAAVPRIYHLNAPLIGKHSWRQTDTAAIARNYYRGGYRFAFPQIDWRGDGPGYVEMELPIYSYALAVAYRAIGDRPAAARGLSLLAAILTIYWLWRLVCIQIDAPTAFWACLFYAVLPLAVFNGRAAMPDSWMLAGTAGGLYAFARWLRGGSLLWLPAAWLGIALACWIKPTNLCLGLPLLALAWLSRGRAVLADWRLYAFAAALAAALAAWFVHAHQLGKASGASFGVLTPEKWAQWSDLTNWRFYRRIFLQSIAERHFVWVGFALLIIGLLLPRRGRSERVFDAWLIGVVITFFVAQRGHFVHDYYQLPFVLAGVVYVGKVYGRYWQRYRVLLTVMLVATAAVSARKYARYMRAEEPGQSHELKAARIIRELTAPDGLVLIAQQTSVGDPTLLYHADRKGWICDLRSLTPQRLASLARRGLRYVIVPCQADYDAQSATWLADSGVHLRVLAGGAPVFVAEIQRPGG